jgi:hypothetical protein
MPKLSKAEHSKSEIKAAISKILARKEALPPVQPRRLPRPNLGKRLTSVFAEAGIDASQLEKIVLEERKEFARLQKKREKYYEKRNSALQKQYKSTLENKKRALKAIGGQTIGVQTVTVDTASTVGFHPEGILNKSKGLEPWNNWAKFFVHDSNNTAPIFQVGHYRYAGVKFIFAWVNRSKSTLIVRANADLITRGFCQAIAQGGVISPGDVSINLDATLKAYPGAAGPGVWGPTNRILEIYAETYADIFGGDGGWATADFNERRNLTLDHLLVNPRTVVIFEVSVDFSYSILNGIAEMEFSSFDRRVTCPALVIEYGGEPTDIGSG